MSSGESILDSLVIAPVALAPATVDEESTIVSTIVRLQTPSGRKLQFASPFFVRGDLCRKADSAWEVLCGLLRRFGLPLFARLGELESLPVANVPARIAVRTLGQPLVKLDLSTADAFELANCDVQGAQWGWPYEIEGSRDLKNFVQVLREATSSEVPIGMSLPLGATVGDMRACIESSIDFLTLKLSTECLAQDASQSASFAAMCILNARRQCAQLGRADLPLLLDTTLTEVEHLIKLLALGATAVNVGSMISAALPVAAPVRSELQLAESLLGSFSPVTKGIRELPQVERCLSSLVARLQAALQFAGLMDVQQFDSNCLRTLSKSVAEHTGIAFLGSR